MASLFFLTACLLSWLLPASTGQPCTPMGARDTGCSVHREGLGAALLQTDLHSRMQVVADEATASAQPTYGCFGRLSYADTTCSSEGRQRLTCKTGPNEFSNKHARLELQHPLPPGSSFTVEWYMKVLKFGGDATLVEFPGDTGFRLLASDWSSHACNDRKRHHYQLTATRDGYVVDCDGSRVDGWTGANWKASDYTVQVIILGAHDVGSGFDCRVRGMFKALTVREEVPRRLASGALPSAGGGSSGTTSYTTPTGWTISSDMPTYNNGDLYWLSNVVDGSDTCQPSTCSERDTRYGPIANSYWLAANGGCTGSSWLEVRMDAARYIDHVVLQPFYRPDSNLTHFRVLADDTDVTPAGFDEQLASYFAGTTAELHGVPVGTACENKFYLDVKATVQRVRVAELTMGNSGYCGFGEITLFGQM